MQGNKYLKKYTLLIVNNKMEMILPQKERERLATV